MGRYRSYIQRGLFITLLFAGLAPVAPTATPQAQLNAALVKAVNNSDAAEIKALLDRGADPNARDIPRKKQERARFPHPPTVLMLAARGGHAAIVKLLLDQGADVRAWGDDRYYVSGTALNEVDGTDALEITKLLLDRGADVNARDNAGRTPLISAAYGNVEMVRLLLAHGADVHARDKGGETALWKAAYEGNVEMARLLLEKGADIETQDKWGGTPLMEAASHSKAEMIAFLVEHGADIHQRRKDGVTALMEAARNGLTESVKLLLARGADINAREHDGSSALMNAASDGKADTFRWLLDHGADVSIRDRQGRTILMNAIPGLLPFETELKDESVSVVRMLLDRKVEINATSRDGDTALIRAAESGSAETVRQLLERGANIHVRNKRGETPLLGAAMSVKAETIRLLLEHGAEVNVRGKDGWTPLMQAAFWFRFANEQSNDSIRLLAEHGADVHVQDKNGVTPLMWLVQAGKAESAAALLKHGADPNARDKDGWSVLKYAVSSAKLAAVRVLLDGGAAIEGRDATGRTALIDAAGGKAWKIQEAEDQTPEIVRLLLERGADVHARDRYGKTSLMEAADYGSPAIIRLLLGHGAEVNAADRDGWTARMYARGRTEIVPLLEQVGARELPPVLSPAHSSASDAFYTLKQAGARISLRRYESDGNIPFALTMDAVVVDLAGSGLADQRLQRAVLSPRGTWLAIGTDNSERLAWDQDAIRLLTLVRMADHRVVYQMRVQEHGSPKDWFQWRGDDRLEFVRRRRLPEDGNYGPYEAFALSGPAWNSSEQKLSREPSDNEDEILLTPAERRRHERAKDRIDAIADRQHFNSTGIHGGEKYFSLDGTLGAASAEGDSIAAVGGLRDDHSPVGVAYRLLLLQAQNTWAVQLVPTDIEKRDVDRIWFWKEWLLFRTRIWRQDSGDTATYVPGTEQMRLFRRTDLAQTTKVDADLFVESAK